MTGDANKRQDNDSKKEAIKITNVTCISQSKPAQTRKAKEKMKEEGPIKE